MGQKNMRFMILVMKEQITLYLLIITDFINLPRFSTDKMVAAHKRSFGLGYPRGSVLLDSVDGL